MSFLGILRSGRARPETKPRRVSGDRLGGTDLIPSKVPVDFHSCAHSEHQVLLSVLGNAVYRRKAVGKSEQGPVLVALTTSSQNGKLNL